MSDYIKLMRLKIGKDSLLLVGSSVIAIKENKILLKKRADSGCCAYPNLS